MMAARRFMILIGCILPCVGLVVGQFPPLSGEADRCSLPPDRRPCTNKGTMRFYFDTDTLRCSSFLFRGCPTRGNNFRSHVECLHTCLMRRGGDFFLEPHPVPDPIHHPGRKDKLYGDPSVDYHYSHKGYARPKYPRRYPPRRLRYSRQTDDNYLPPDTYGPLPRRVEAAGNSGYPRREMYEPSPLEYEYRRPGSYGWYREGMQEEEEAKKKEAQPPIRPPVPPVPKDGSPPRGNGWVIEVIHGGYRAIKDDRKYNGWRHTYSRVFRTHPDGIAGASFWSMVSEFDPHYDSTAEQDATDEIRRQEALIYNRVTREPHTQDPDALGDMDYPSETAASDLDSSSDYGPLGEFNRLSGALVILPSRPNVILDTITKDRLVNNMNDVIYIAPRGSGSQTGQNTVSFKKEYYDNRSPMHAHAHRLLRTSQEALYKHILHRYLRKYLSPNAHINGDEHDVDMHRRHFVHSPRLNSLQRKSPPNHYIYVSSGSNSVPLGIANGAYRHAPFDYVMRKYLTPRYKQSYEVNEIATQFGNIEHHVQSKPFNLFKVRSPTMHTRTFPPLQRRSPFSRGRLFSTGAMVLRTPGYVIMCTRWNIIPCRLYKGRRRVHSTLGTYGIDPYLRMMLGLDPKSSTTHPMRHIEQPNDISEAYFGSTEINQYSHSFPRHSRLSHNYITPITPYVSYRDSFDTRDNRHSVFRPYMKQSIDNNPGDFISVDHRIDPEREFGPEMNRPRPPMPNQGRVFLTMTGAGPQQSMRAFGMHQQQAADEHRIMAVGRFEGQHILGAQRAQDYPEVAERGELPDLDGAPLLPTDGTDEPEREPKRIESPPFDDGQGVVPEDMAKETPGDQSDGAYSGDSDAVMSENESEDSPTIVDTAPQEVKEEVGAHPDAPGHKSSIIAEPEIITELTTSIPQTTEPVTRERTHHSSVEQDISQKSQREISQDAVPEHPVFIPPQPPRIPNPAIRPPAPPYHDHRRPPFPQGFTRSPGVHPAVRSPPPPRVFMRSSASTPDARPPPPPGIHSPCLLAPDPGPCRAMVNRWYFNSMQGRCMILLYGGCHGNANNFVSREECMDICQDFTMAVTVDTPMATTAPEIGVDNGVSPPAPPPKITIQGNPWPGFLHLYSRLLVSTLSRVNKHLRPDLATSTSGESPLGPAQEESKIDQALEESMIDQLSENTASVEQSTDGPFSSTLSHGKDMMFMPIHTTPKPDVQNELPEEDEKSTFDKSDAEPELFPNDYHDDISESGEVEDSITPRKMVEFTPSPAETNRYHSAKDDYDEDEEEDQDSSGIRIPPWERVRDRHTFRPKFEEFRSRDRPKFEEFRSRDRSQFEDFRSRDRSQFEDFRSRDVKEWGRYKKFGDGGKGKNKGLTLMQIFVHKGEPRHPPAMFPMMYRRPRVQPPWLSSFKPGPPGPPRFASANPFLPSHREYERRPSSENDMIFYALWQRQQQQQQQQANYRSTGKAAAGEANLGCLQPLETAFCPIGQPLLRWYYNLRTSSCEMFFFGGCGAGNFNRFSTKEQCQATCMTTSPGPEVTQEATTMLPVTTTTTPPERPPYESTTVGQEDNTPSRETTDRHNELGADAENDEFGGPEVASASMRVDRDVEYATVIVILCVGALALVVLAGLVGLYLMRKFRKTEPPKREKVVEAVLKAHLFGGMSSLPFKMPPPPPAPTVETSTDGLVKEK